MHDECVLPHYFPLVEAAARRYRLNIGSIIKAIKDPRLILILLLGFSSGLPLLLVGQTLKALLTDHGIALATIGFFTFVKAPYAWKFVWSPFMDRFSLTRHGRRRSWLLVTQIALAVCLAGVAMVDPKTDIYLLAAMAFLVAFFSASQDIVIDAYIRELLPDEELGLGSAVMVNGYRVAMLVSGGFALYLAEKLSWGSAYMIMGALMGVGILATLFAPEPNVGYSPPKSLREAYVGAITEFFKRDGALKVLGILLLYKVGESMATEMLTPFYMKIGFTKTEIFAVAKMVGFWATIFGGTVGGLIMVRLGLFRSLVLFGVLQSLAILFYSFLSTAQHSLVWLGCAVGGELFTSAMATAAFTAFIYSQANKRYSATQCALFTSAYANTGLFFGAGTGMMAEHLGWQLYFVVCMLFTIPGLLILLSYKKYAEAMP
jgi:PAT family beta-lactamase induction signal transducer AmpG